MLSRFCIARACNLAWDESSPLSVAVLCSLCYEDGQQNLHCNGTAAECCTTEEVASMSLHAGLPWI